MAFRIITVPVAEAIEKGGVIAIPDINDLSFTDEGHCVHIDKFQSLLRDTQVVEVEDGDDYNIVAFDFSDGAKMTYNGETTIPVGATLLLELHLGEPEADEADGTDDQENKSFLGGLLN